MKMENEEASLRPINFECLMLIYLGSIFVDSGIFSVVHESILQHEMNIINELPGLGIPMVI